MKRYCTPFRIGYWASLDAECTTRTDEVGLLDHHVEFRLINKYGESFNLGLSIFGQPPDGDGYVFDEDGEDFPSLEAAVRHQAEELVRLSAMPVRWVPHPPRHDTWQATVATAFAD
jgi:hypothetical protein